MKRYTHVILVLLTCVIGSSCGCSSTPNHDRAIEIGRNYSTTVFDLTLTGTRPLGTNENFRIEGHILPVTKRVKLGDQFTLTRGDIISLTGVLTEIDKDHLQLKGHFKGHGPLNRPIDIEVDIPIGMGIHGGTHYFRDPKNHALAAMGNDNLSIRKIDVKELPNRVAGD
jgi:hypothetical protein